MTEETFTWQTRLTEVLTCFPSKLDTVDVECLSSWTPELVTFFHSRGTSPSELFSPGSVAWARRCHGARHVWKYLIFPFLSYLIVSTSLLMKMKSNIWQHIFCCVHLAPCWLEGKMKSEHFQAGKDGVLALPCINYPYLVLVGFSIAAHRRSKTITH